MKVLVVGGGGREHALVWKIKQSPLVKKIYCAPGNAGIADLAECVPIGAEAVDQLLAFARREKIDLTVVGPEGPSGRGYRGPLRAEGLRIFGASQKAAAIEASKSFAKQIMNKYGVPTARGAVFQQLQKAEAYVRKMGAPVVVKADGLAAGKGVIVCASVAQAVAALKLILVDKAFGEAGRQVVVEECLRARRLPFWPLPTARRSWRCPPPRTTNRSLTTTRGPTPAAWAPIRRPRWWTGSCTSAS
jgi:phosphoribosylamine---glycine ligase